MLSAPSFDWYLVALSAAIALCASYVALDLASRSRRHLPMQRWGLVLAAALALGGGIWALQVVGMIGFRFPMQAVNSVPSLVLTAFCSVVGATVGMLPFSGGKPMRAPSVFMLCALAIATMFGGHAWTLSVLSRAHILHYDPAYGLAALVVAVLACRVVFRRALAARTTQSRAVAAFVLGASICAVFYASIAGVQMVDERFPRPNELDADALSIALMVSFATFMALFLGLIVASADRTHEETFIATTSEARRSREFASLLVASTTEGIIAIDEDAVVTVWNPAMERFLGVPASEAIGRSIPKLMTPALSVVFNPLLAALNGDEAAIECNISSTSRDLHLAGQSTVIHADDGAIRGGLLFLRDETALLRARDERRQAQKLEALGQLVGSVAHDFGNLLTTVSGNIQMIELGGPDPKRINAVKKATTAGRELIDKLLGFARKSGVEQSELDPAEILLGMETILTTAAPEPHSIDFSGVGTVGSIQANRHDLENAILNLVNNARDAMPKGGKISLSVSEEIVREDDGVERGASIRSGRYVRISVSDKGSGMTENVRARVFEPFFTTKPVGYGTGLGLSQVFLFARQSNGVSVVRSAPGSGTTVDLYIPSVGNRAAFPSKAQSQGTSLKAARPEPPSGTMTESPGVVLMVGDSWGAHVGETLALGGADTLLAIELDEGLRILDDKNHDIAAIVLSLDATPARILEISAKYQRLSEGRPIFIVSDKPLPCPPSARAVFGLPFDGAAARAVMAASGIAPTAN